MIDEAYVRELESLNPELVPFLRKPTAQRVDTSIITLDRPVWGAGLTSQFPRYNPDDLVGKKGLQIYAKMRTDEQVKAVCTFKRDAILSRGWTFDWDDGSQLSPEEQDQRSRIIQQIIQWMPGSFIDVLNIIATGREFGFSITEKLYQPVEIDGRTWVGLRALRGRDPSTFQFMTDEYGELDYVRQLMAGRIIEFQLDKFVHYVHNPEFDPYLGQSDLREAYRSWYMKDTLIRLWAFYMEKLGGGLTVAQASEQANLTPNSKEHLALQAAFSNMKASSYILLPAGVTAEVHFPQGTDSFKAAIEFHDLAIAKALLVPNLMGVSSTGRTGSYAQSQTQLESFAWTLKADTMRLEACVDEQIVKDLCEQNWGDGDYPHFKFKPLSTQAMMQLITTWAALIQAKAVIPTEDDEDRLREILEMPARDEDAKPLAVIMQEMMPAPEPSPAPTEGDQLTPQAEGIAPPKVAPVEPKAAVGRSFRRPGKPKLRVVAHTPTGEPRTVTREAFTRALARVEFAVIDAKTNRMAYDGVRQAARLAARATRRVLDPETLPTLLKDNVQDIGDVKIDGTDVGKIKGAFKDGLTNAWDFGVQQARRELTRAKRPTTLNRARFAALRQKTADFIEANGFRMAQNLTDGMRSIIQQELLAGVKSGARPEAVTASIYNRLIRAGFTTLEATQAEEPRKNVMDDTEAALADAIGTANVPAYLNTLVRTNNFEALNEARYEEFTDPALADFVLALEYSAILDDRTTEICRALDGSVWADDSPNWDDYRPPNHYNCRSVLVPVTTLDGWDGVESDDPSVEPQAGFTRKRKT